MNKYKLYDETHCHIKSGTAQELIHFLESKNNYNQFSHLVGSVVKFSYRKDGNWRTESRRIKVDSVNNQYLAGYDLEVTGQPPYRQFRFDRIDGQIKIV